MEIKKFKKGDTITTIEIIRVGDKAKSFKADQEAFDTLKEDLMNRWEHSGSTELEARESIWLAMRLLDRIHGHFKSILETGQMAKALEKQHPFI